MAFTVPAPPEQGQLVDVRQRRYVVTNVMRSALPGDPLQVPGYGLQHLVSLASVEDDAIGVASHRWCVRRLGTWPSDPGDSAMRYRADITAGSLKVPESRIIADVFLRDVDKEEGQEAPYASHMLPRSE